MPDSNNEQLTRARAFFERAEQVARTNNFDYAIDMYLEGLRCAPDALEEGHLKLHELALLRQTKGGKKPSVSERLRRLRGKNALEQMINAEYLFAKDPDHLPYAEAVLKAALQADCPMTGKWIADLVFQANNALARPSLQTYLLLRDSYEALELLDRAVVACQFALTVKPDDKLLQDEYQRLSTELTVSNGKYDNEGDFRKALKDREFQEKLQSQQSVVKTMDWRLTAVKDAREKFDQNPELSRSILDLAYALSDIEQDDTENEAIELLDNAYHEKGDFNFRLQAGLIRIRQLRREIAGAEDALEAGGNDQAKKGLELLQRRLIETELEHFRSCTENYPTDAHFKYEYALRLLDNKQYDQAIPLFQEAQKDPRHKYVAMGEIGRCFYLKGWFADAIDVLSAAVDAYELKNDDTAKQLRYNLGRSYEAGGNNEKALEVFRKLAQLDFAYKDVSERINELRSKNKSASQ